jgi:hypothetical protein
METAVGWRAWMEMGMDGDDRWTERARRTEKAQGEEPGVCVGARRWGGKGQALTRVGAWAAAGIGRTWSGQARVEEDQPGTPACGREGGGGSGGAPTRSSGALAGGAGRDGRSQRDLCGRGGFVRTYEALPIRVSLIRPG